MQRYSPPSPETVADNQRFADDIYIMSDGRIEIEVFWGGELVPNDTMLEAVGRGTLEIAQGYGGYWPGKVDVGIIEAAMPSAWTSYEEALWFWYGLGFDELVREAYAENNAHYIRPVFGGKYDLLTKEPVESLDDLKGRKIRATSTVAKLLNKLDISTVYLPAEELYTGLATGIVDGVIYGDQYTYWQYKLHETATYYTCLGLLYPGFVDNLIINTDVWNTLPEDLQRMVELAALRLADAHYLMLVKRDQMAQEKAVFTVGILPASDSALLAECAQDVWDEEAAKSARAAEAIEMLRRMARAAERL